MTGPLTRLIHVRIPTSLAESLDSKLRMRRTTQPDATVSSYIRDLVTADLAGPGPRGAEKVRSPRPAKTPERPEVGESARFSLPHIVQSDGSCAGGCDPDVDTLCSVGPADPRRTGKRRR